MLRQLLAKDAAVCLQSFLAFSLCLLLVELQWRQVVGQAAAGNHYNKGCASGVRSTFTIIVIGEVGASHLVTSPHLTGLTTFTQQGESVSESIRGLCCMVFSQELYLQHEFSNTFTCKPCMQSMCTRTSQHMNVAVHCCKSALSAAPSQHTH